MKYISTTELRTKSTELIADLKLVESVNLIYRSEVVGVIVPAKNEDKKPSAEALERFLKLAHRSKKTSREEREAIYAEHLEQKYGKNLS